MPRVSVLTPVYRTPEKFLRAAIESILAQTFTDFEFLLLDDCPDDPREDVIRSYHDPRIVYLRNDHNLGITPSRNKLMRLAKGEYLAVFDHDDLSLPDRLAKEVAYLDANPECGAVSCAIRELPQNTVRTFPEDFTDLQYRMMREIQIWHPSSLLRKSVLEKYQIRYEERFTPAEDYGIFLRLMKVCRLHNLPDVLFEYRHHETNTTRVQFDRICRANERVWAVAKELFPDVYAEWCRDNLVSVTRHSLLGLPVWKSVRKGGRTRGYLFNVIPVYTARSKDVV